MEGATQVAKWCNRLAVCLPAVVVEAAGLKQGNEIAIDIVDAGACAVARKPGREELVERLRAWCGLSPTDFKFDRDEANARWLRVPFKTPCTLIRFDS